VNWWCSTTSQYNLHPDDEILLIMSVVDQVLTQNMNTLGQSEIGRGQKIQAELRADIGITNSPCIASVEEECAQLEVSDVSKWIEKMGERVGRHKKVHDVCLTFFSSLPNELDSAALISPDQKKMSTLVSALEVLQVEGYGQLQVEKQAKQRAIEFLGEPIQIDHAAIVDGRSISVPEKNFSNKWDRLVAMIDASDQKNVEGYASALEQYTRLYQGVSNVLSKLGTLVTTSDDNKMTVDFPKIKEMLNKLLQMYLPPAEGNTIAGTVRNGLSKSQADQICKALKLPDECRVQNKDLTYCVIPDVSQVQTMLDSLPTKNNLSVAHYNAWKSGFDAQMNRIEEVLQDRGHKYSYTFGRFENFYKTISFILQSMTDMLKIYSNAMRGS